MQYLGSLQFWLAVIVVAVVVNFAWMKFFSGSGKLV